MMKALTVSRSDAMFILDGAKKFENRSKLTSHRGSLLIHVEKSDLGPAEIVGSVDLWDCVHLSAVKEREGTMVGPFCWLFKDPVRFSKPIACSGHSKDGLWIPDEKAQKQLCT